MVGLMVPLTVFARFYIGESSYLTSTLQCSDWSLIEPQHEVWEMIHCKWSVIIVITRNFGYS